MAPNNDEVIVHVLDGELVERKGEFTNDAGEKIAYETRKQAARLEVGGFVYPYDVRLERGQSPFKPGAYRMALSKMLKINNSAHGIGKFPILEPLPQAK